MAALYLQDFLDTIDLYKTFDSLAINSYYSRDFTQLGFIALYSTILKILISNDVITKPIFFQSL